MLPSADIRAICQKIGEYYLDKCERDFVITADKILALQIQNVEVSEDIVTITTARPGMLIGKRGENLDALEKILGKKIKVVESYFTWTDLITPHQETEKDYEGFEIPDSWYGDENV